jgi:GH15 family glucan-1,4-alpha-glucosidase
VEPGEVVWQGKVGSIPLLVGVPPHRNDDTVGKIDAASGRHLGNYPQAFTHLSLVNAVLELIAAEA